MKAKVIRGVYIRGKAYPEGAIVEVTGLEFAELKGTNYVVAVPEEPAEATDGEPAIERPARDTHSTVRRRGGA